MNDITVIGVDPGQHTGVAVWDSDTDSTCVYTASPIMACALVHSVLKSHCDRRVDTVIEAYRIGRATAAPVEVEIIGAVRYLTSLSGAHKLWVCGASSVKRMATDDVLERLGWLRRPKGKMRHVNDALRQIVYHRTVVIKDLSVLL